jgi:hypothetical protein
MPTVTGPYTTAPNPAAVILGRGMLFIDNFDANGNRTGQQAVGNVTTFDTENKVEVKEKYESMDPASSLYARGVVRETVTLKITGDEFTLDNLQRALLGTIAVITSSGATITAETITPTGGAILNRYYDLAHRNITALTDVKQASTTLVLGTDYTADLVRGRIYLMPTSPTITPGSALTADYTYATYTYNAVNIATVGTIDAYVRFLGNPVKGPTYEAEYWHVSFTPTGQLGFIADDFGNWTLEGQVIADTVNHATNPIGRLIQTA